MSATTTMTNGKPQRKQLADQLDRMDSIIDALADGLPGAVADACRDGARLAVKDAIIEIMSNPELRAMLVPPTRVMPAPTTTASSPEPIAPRAPKPNLWAKLKAKVAAAKDFPSGEQHPGNLRSLAGSVEAVGTGACSDTEM